MHIRRATLEDRSRIAEIFVINNRLFNFPIFHDEEYSFNYLTVERVMNEMLTEEFINQYYVYDDGVIRGFIRVVNQDLDKLYIDSFFHDRGVGSAMMDFAVNECDVKTLWVLEKNEYATVFYRRYGFKPNGIRMPEGNTGEYNIQLERK